MYFAPLAHAQAPPRTIADAEKGVQVAGERPVGNQLRQLMQNKYMVSFELKKALEVMRQREAVFEAKGSPQRQFVQRLSTRGGIARVQAGLSDFDAAQASLKWMDMLYAQARSTATPEQLDLYGGFWEEAVNIAWAQYYQVRGQWKESEQRAARAEGGRNAGRRADRGPRVSKSWTGSTACLGR